MSPTYCIGLISAHVVVIIFVPFLFLAGHNLWIAFAFLAIWQTVKGRNIFPRLSFALTNQVRSKVYNNFVDYIKELSWEPPTLRKIYLLAYEFWNDITGSQMFSGYTILKRLPLPHHLYIIIHRLKTI